MNRIVFIVILSIVSFRMVAQTEVMRSLTNLSIAADNASGFNRDVYIDGTPYQLEENVTGIFYQKNKMVVKAPTRLNYFQSNFEFQLDGKTHLVDANTIDSVLINDMTYVYRTLEVKGKTKPCAVKLVGHVGNNSIYSFTEVELKPEVKASGYVEPKPATYNWVEPVYLFEISGNLIVLTNFKKLTSTFPEKENEIKRFIKENKIKKDYPDDLKKLLGYISKL
jgi:hypothetical protein